MIDPHSEYWVPDRIRIGAVMVGICCLMLGVLLHRNHSQEYRNSVVMYHRAIALKSAVVEEMELKAEMLSDGDLDSLQQKVERIQAAGNAALKLRHLRGPQGEASMYLLLAGVVILILPITFFLVRLPSRCVGYFEVMKMEKARKKRVVKWVPGGV